MPSVTPVDWHHTNDGVLSSLTKISGYTLTVQAADNGNPPRVNTTTVNIDVSDVNDNAPLFSRDNYSVIIQVSGRCAQGRGPSISDWLQTLT